MPLEESLRFGAVEVRTAQRQVLADGRPAAIGARAFVVLLMLLEHRDRVVTKDELLDGVWAGLVVEENNLQVQISTLRRLLGAGAIATVPARGYRFVAVADVVVTPAADATATSPALASPPASPLASPLPRLRTAFFGREREKQQALDHLRTASLLTLIGIGGSGKTRLALEIAREAQPGFPDGVAFVDLASVGDGQDVDATVANGLGIRLMPGTPVLQRLAERIGSARLLLVLDNCEHLLAPVAALVDALLTRCEGLRVLVTSREALGLEGEQVQPVGALRLGSTEDLAALRDSDAARLFVDRARLAEPGFELDARNAAAVHEVCKRLDCIPLALELAAARLNVLSVDQLKARLDDRFRLLSGGRRALPRQQTLDAVVRWSYEHLSAAEQRLLQRLSVFSGGTTIEAAVFVSAPETAEHDVIEQLSNLSALSLIGLNADGPEPRHGMLETVRLFALERLNEAGEMSEARERHLAFFTERARPLVNPQDTHVDVSAYAALVADQDNLIAALRYGAHGGTPARAWSLARALNKYWERCGLLELGHTLLEAMLAATGPELEGPTKARALSMASYSAINTGRYERCMQLAEEHLQLARALADPEQEFSALASMTMAALALNDAPAARRHVESMEALGLHGQERLLRTLRHFKAETSLALGCFDEAEALHRQNLDAAVAGGQHDRILHETVSLVLVALARPDLDSARAWTERALAVRARGDYGVYGVAHILLIAAALHAADEDWSAAARLHGAAEAQLHHSGQRMEPIDMASLAPFLAKARAALAADAYGQAFAAGRALDQPAILSLVADCLPRSTAS